MESAGCLRLNVFVMDVLAVPILVLSPGAGVQSYLGVHLGVKTWGHQSLSAPPGIICCSFSCGSSVFIASHLHQFWCCQIFQFFPFGGVCSTLLFPLVDHYIFISQLYFFFYEMPIVFWQHLSIVQILWIICFCSQNTSLLLVGIHCSIFFYSDFFNFFYGILWKRYLILILNYSFILCLLLFVLD